MSNNFHTPAEVIDHHTKAGHTKATQPIGKMILLGVMAGAVIAMGSAASSVPMHLISNAGIARMIGGTIFPVGLMMVVFLGAELFTGNCLVTMAVLAKHISWKQLISSWIIVYLSNILGALFVSVVVFFSGHYNMSGGTLGAFTIQVAVNKTNLSAVNGIASGILCNMLVCIAILIAASAKDIAGKILGIFFPIWAFFVSGYEHCVANFYYIPAGILAATNPEYVEKAQEVFGISASQCEALGFSALMSNVIPVTVGNIIGGVFCIGVNCFAIHRKEWKANHLHKSKEEKTNKQ